MAISSIEKEFDLNIKTILENWEVYHALREIIANALDETVLSNSPDIKIEKESNIWHIRDFGRGLNYHHLTQNENEEKIQHEHLIGRFGVGLKDALATLYRNKVEVTIKSKHGTITLVENAKAGFDDVITLHAKIMPPLDPKMIGTDFCLAGCTDEDINKAKALFLKFSNLDILECNNYGQVIRNKTDVSHIFVNGVKVASEPNFLFSYNITSLTSTLKRALNRERANVGRSAYSSRIQDILMSCESGDVIDPIIEDNKKYGSGKIHDELLWTNVALYAAKKMSEKETKTTFVTTAELERKPVLIDELKRDGFTPVVVSETISQKMEDNNRRNEEIDKKPLFTTTSQYVKKVNETFEPEIIRVEDLSADEKKVYEKMDFILSLIGGKPTNVHEILIVESLYQSLYHTNTVGQWEAASNRIFIKRSELSCIESFANVLLHECAHAISGEGDVNREFELELSRLLGILAQQTLSLYDISLQLVSLFMKDHGYNEMNENLSSSNLEETNRLLKKYTELIKGQ